MLVHVFAVLTQIYCTGPILDAVQKSNLFEDSKYFVDMSLKFDPVTTLRHFRELQSSVGDVSLDLPVLSNFVKEHFEDPGSELLECYPEDFNPSPGSFSIIQDYNFKKWALALNRLWKLLCRKVKDDVRDRPDRYSLLYVPHPFIIPGGRFREFYYWDTYWILKGLLFSEMYPTARGVIRNLAYMVEQHGFVPNGGRVYYMARSHPPLLIPMVHDYYIATGDIDFLFELLPSLEKEYKFWLQNRATVYEQEGKNSKQYFQYRASMNMPRPESYREDMELVHNISSLKEKERLWSNIASAAETGWDFSTRWFSHSGPDAFRFQSIKTWSIIPVDLNAFMCMNARILATLFEITGNFSKVSIYQNHFKQAKYSMKKFHWNNEDGIWYDFDLDSGRHVREYYISNFLPLFAKCYDKEDVPRRAYAYLEKLEIFNTSMTVPSSSFIDSGQQWDSSNAWPPMVHILIEGMRTSGDPFVQQKGKEIASLWLNINYKSYIQTKAMFEKYNVSGTDSYAGSGGEYEVQTGFGWSNGVVLDLLAKYGNDVFAAGSRTEIPNWILLVALIVNLFWLNRI